MVIDYYALCRQAGQGDLADFILVSEENSKYRLSMMYQMLARGARITGFVEYKGTFKLDGKVSTIEVFDQHPHWVPRKPN